MDDDDDDDDDQSLVNDYQPLNYGLWHWLTIACNDVIESLPQVGV